ncbi:hypothetical protein CEXT_44251 [Caerostris extrusa]|uniref:FDX-ACB domain-containing protein n=1 Tax=Caerostris extrusa TaxID=172846 RepID=A0AAV4P6Q2_CAEEX|nr:hypothetical protein CEXT_44251 [Caerostris extrusa]
MLAWNAGGGMIKSVTLIDVYHEISTNRRSRCYRFHYQSFNKVLTEENVSKTHSYLRHLIETKLKVKLR